MILFHNTYLVIILLIAFHVYFSREVFVFNTTKYRYNITVSICVSIVTCIVSFFTTTFKRSDNKNRKNYSFHKAKLY